MTFINVINSVLRQLRETEASSVMNSSYTQLIGQYVNQVIEEMEDRWDWARMEQTVRFTIDAGERKADLISPSTDVTNSIYINERATLVYDPQKQPMMFDVTDAGDESQLRLENINSQKKRVSLSLEETNRPCAFSVSRTPTTDGTVRMDTMMDKARNFAGSFSIPQGGELSVTTTDDTNTEVILPSRPIILGTVFYALNERGEEIGEPGGIAERRWEAALASAVENDDRQRMEYQNKFFQNDEGGSGTIRNFNFSAVWK